MLKSLRVGAMLALALSTCAPAMAQVPAGVKAQAPAGFLPGQASFCSTDNGVTWAPCSGSGGGGSGGPTRAGSTVTSGTIASGGAYQSALAASGTRLGCTIQNTGTATLRVFVGAPGSASNATAFAIDPGGAFSCASPGGVVLTDQISVASAAAGAPFVVVSQ